MLHRLINKRTPKGAYAFIDNQNLNLGVQSVGWKLDWHKFRNFLTEEYGVTEAYMFIGYVPEYESMYKQMYDTGYNVILRPTVGMFAEESERPQTTKGNVDVDLVLRVMMTYEEYDKAVIISGDGDFYSLVEYLIEKNKLCKLLTPNGRYSSLLNEFGEYIVRIDKFKKQLAYKNHRPKRKTTQMLKKSQ